MWVLKGEMELDSFTLSDLFIDEHRWRQRYQKFLLGFVFTSHMQALHVP